MSSARGCILASFGLLLLAAFALPLKAATAPELAVQPGKMESAPSAAPAECSCAVVRHPGNRCTVTYKLTDGSTLGFTEQRCTETFHAVATMECYQLTMARHADPRCE